MKPIIHSIMFLLMVAGLVPISCTAAPLNVVGAANPFNAMPGNNQNVLLLVSVTDQNGAAVAGLDASGFHVNAIVVPPGGPRVNMSNVDKSKGDPGFYIIELVPNFSKGKQNTWYAGIYLLGVTVEKGRDRGQTVIPLDLYRICSQSASPTQPLEENQQGRNEGSANLRKSDGVSETTLINPEVGTATSVSGTSNPEPGLPDLVITARVSGNPAFSQGGHVATIPLIVNIRNLGTTTSERFKISTAVGIEGEPVISTPFLVSGQEDSWYAWQDALQAGMTTTLNGYVRIDSPSKTLDDGKMLNLFVKVDSCLGDESMPGYCRVQETSETNNEARMNIQLGEKSSIFQ